MNNPVRFTIYFIGLIVVIIGIGLGIANLPDIPNPRITEAVKILTERLGDGQVTIFYKDDGSSMFAIKRIWPKAKSSESSFIIYEEEGFETRVVELNNIDELEKVDWNLQGDVIRDYPDYVWFMENKVYELFFPEKIRKK